MKYEGVGGIGYDMYSGERGKTTVLRHWGGLKKHEELEGDLRPLLRERERVQLVRFGEMLIVEMLSR